MSPELTPMSAIDRAWLRMDTPTNPMMISSVLIFDHPLSIPRLKRTLRERLLCYDRFHQRVVSQRGRVYWQDDPLFDIDNHLHRIGLPGNAGMAELQALASDLNSTTLDSRRPLWQIHCIDNLNGNGGALLVRIHHCIADGISLVRVLLSLTDRTPEPRLDRIAPRPDSRRSPRSAARRLSGRLADNAKTAATQARHFLRALRRNPGYPIQLATAAGGITMDLLKLGLAPFEPDTGLKTPLSGRKQVAWAKPLALADVKACAKSLGGSINDVLLCAATGALQRYFLAHGESIPPCGIRVAVPFNLRPRSQPVRELGNQFGLVLVCLPVDVPEPVMCFHQVQENMNRLKRSWQAQVTYSLLDLFGRGPDALERRALDLLSHKASAVLTNVPGPRQPVYLAGSKLVQPMFWVPQTGNIGIGMSIFSYADTVQFGISVDTAIRVNPNEIMSYFRESFETLNQAAQAANQPQLARQAG